ncbi:hypothetical protein ACHAXR_009762, partial [Thalassiosira sp. AJA248-18]
ANNNLQTTNSSTNTKKTILDKATQESNTICINQGFKTLPLLSMECKYYVTCSGQNSISQTYPCPQNLLFDTSINGCNWDYMVVCPTWSPTVSPTLMPTELEPTISPSNVPTRFPTRRPTKIPTKLPTMEPTRRPTNPPSGKPTMRPTNTRPVYSPVEVQQVQPSSPSDQQSENTRPTPRPTPRPTQTTTATAPPPNIYAWLQSHRRALNQEVFRSYTREGEGYRTAFLAHAMTESITKDACDEFHWEKNSDGDVSCSSDKSSSSGGGGGGGKQGACGDNHYAISNSCGQAGMNYQEFQCMEGEEHMSCNVDRNMILQASTSVVYPNAPPPLTCRPRTVGESFTGYWDVGGGDAQSMFPYENTYGRTNVEGCCYWGRGAIHTKGVCNLGKIDYYLGKRAAEEGRPSRYPTTDFCAFPEAICAAPESREMRWVTSMFEWTERIQSYDDKKGWNYMRKLKEFVDHGLIDFEFLEATSGILTKGCHDPPCVGSGSKINGGWGSGDVHLAEERVKNFQTILIALEAGGEDALLRALIKYFADRQDTMNSQILRSQTPQGQLYPSYRYQHFDFLAALTYIADGGVDNGRYKFYKGEARVPEGVRYGVVNTVMFLAQAYKESIQYDACDENNWQMVNDRFPLSNSCGQLNMSYQDMHCREDEAYMECPVKPSMEQVALTSALWFQAPGPFKCGPRSTFPTTGFWDYDAGREDNEDAYANARGRVDVEGCCWWGRGIIQTRGTCNYGKLNYFLGKRAADEGRTALYPKIDFCDFPQGVCSSDETYGGELQWMVGFFEWTDRIQTYDVDGWNYIEKLQEFTDGGYKDWSFVDAVSGIVNIGCHNPPCKGFGGYPNTAVDPHNKRDRNDTFQRFLNQLQVERNFRPPPQPTPMPSPYPTDEPTPAVPTTNEPTELNPPTESPTITSRPTALQGRPPDEAVNDIETEVVASKARFSELLLMSEHPSGTLWPSYLYTWNGFKSALEKMTTGVGPGEKNFFYIGDGYSDKSLEYGLVNIAAFVAQGVTQSIYYDACDENSWEMVNFRYPISNSCGQEGLSYQEDVCDDDDEDEAGLECEVDPTMEIQGVTHAGWVGAPPPMYCGPRSVGYWDHITGLEVHDPPFQNAGERSDIRGCCWWGRGVLQVRGVCSYGKLNHWLGAKAASENRASIYPDIDFCKNPGAICSDRRAPELRWVTGMFHWVQTVQRSREYDYFPTLKSYVDGGDYTDGSFIGLVNAMLGGNADEISRRTKMFFDALRAFNLITVETNSTGTPIHTYCGVGFNDAGSKCTPCETNYDCAGLELCYADVMACDVPAAAAADEDWDVDVGTNVTMNGNEEGAASISTVGNDTTEGATIVDAAGDAPVALTMPIASTTNYCGSSWGDAASKCVNACPSGTSLECAPGQSCFGDITTCSNNNNYGGQMAASNNYCGVDWSDASTCRSTCPSGTDAECPDNQKCFGDIHC